MVGSAREVERAVFVLSHGVNVRAVRDERYRHLLVPRERRPVKRGVAVVLLHARVRAALIWCREREGDI